MWALPAVTWTICLPSIGVPALATAVGVVVLAEVGHVLAAVGLYRPGVLRVVAK